MLDLSKMELSPFVDFVKEILRKPVCRYEKDDGTDDFGLYVMFQRSYDLKLHDDVKQWFYSDDKIKHLSVFEYFQKEWNHGSLELVPSESLNDKMIEATHEVLSAVFTAGFKNKPEVFEYLESSKMLENDVLTFSLIYEGIYGSAFVSENGDFIREIYSQVGDLIYIETNQNYFQPVINSRVIRLAQLYCLSMGYIIEELNELYENNQNKDKNELISKIIYRLIYLWKVFSIYLQFVLDNYSLLEKNQNNPVYNLHEKGPIIAICLKDEYSVMLEDLKEWSEDDAKIIFNQALDWHEIRKQYMEYMQFFFDMNYTGKVN